MMVCAFYQHYFWFSFSLSKHTRTHTIVWCTSGRRAPQRATIGVVIDTTRSREPNSKTTIRPPNSSALIYTHMCVRARAARM